MKENIISFLLFLLILFIGFITLAELSGMPGRGEFNMPALAWAIIYSVCVWVFFKRKP